MNKKIMHGLLSINRCIAEFLPFAILDGASNTVIKSRLEYLIYLCNQILEELE